jgi:very-short-patch-repair endonuclease
MLERRNRSRLFRERAREMRHQPNGVEAMVWSGLRNRRVGGLKFRRQHPIGPYIADFYCAEARLIIELDGATHEGKEDYDAKRQAWLESQGHFVLRVPNLELDGALDSFWEAVFHKCVERTGKCTRSAGPSP